MKTLLYSRNSLTQQELICLEQLEISENKIPQELMLTQLLEKFECYSVEGLIKKVKYLGILPNTPSTFKNASESTKICKFRKLILEIGFCCPKELCDFFFDIYKLKEKDNVTEIKIRANKLANDKNIIAFFDRYEQEIKNFSEQEYALFKRIFNQNFIKKEYKDIAKEMKTLLKHNMAAICCHIRNVIDDNCPIIISDELTEAESGLLDFLTNKGDIIDYTKISKKEICTVSSIAEKVCHKYNVHKIEDLIMLNIIETQYRKENMNYINLLTNLNIDKAIENIKNIGKIIAPEQKHKTLQLKNKLETLKVEIAPQLNHSQYQKLFTIIKAGKKEALI